MSLPRFSDLSPAVKIGLSLAAGASIFAVLFMLMNMNTTVMLIVLAGLLVVGLLLVGYQWLLLRSKRKKAKPFEGEIKSNSGAVPQDVTDAGGRAKIDSLRKNFEDGIAKFRTSGLDLYSLPWYLIAGEAGSGKTEAIRHCNISFPPGLQDPLQGVGGTLNMNWWFTNHAVILDTAGRMFFESVEAGGSGEWREFLALLRKHRPTAPINGLILSISAESLIKDTAEEIKNKGDKIAQQLDVIQRVLDVRFPVFIVVTKCDLINGFRELFDNIRDPNLQHQMVGWTNPSALDEPFKPEAVEQHLAVVVDRLQRRRFGMLLEPPAADDPAATRTDRVDALFAAPNSLEWLAPRLRLYLEKIFVTGKWAGKPLFVRGIYLTSAIREGNALDAQLAEALNTTVDRLPQGRVWERNRSFFLQDLFMKKVFREWGLVTRASNAKSQHRLRRAVVLGVGIACVLFLLMFSWLGKRSLNRSVGTELKCWASGARKDNWQGPFWSPIVERSLGSSNAYDYIEGVEGSNSARKAAWLKDLDIQSRKPLRFPRIFAIAAGFIDRKQLDMDRQKAIRVLFERSIVKPVLAAGRSRMTHTPPEDVPAWGPVGEEALAWLITLESLDGGNRKWSQLEREQREQLFGSLLNYVLERKPGDTNSGAWKRGMRLFDEDKSAIASVAGRVLDDASFETGTDLSLSASEAGLEKYCRRIAQPDVKGPVGDAIDRLRMLDGLRASLQQLQDAEQAVLDAAWSGEKPTDPADSAALDQKMTVCKNRLRELDDAAAAVAEKIDLIKNDSLAQTIKDVERDLCRQFYSQSSVLSALLKGLESDQGTDPKIESLEDCTKLLERVAAIQKPLDISGAPELPELPGLVEKIVRLWCPDDDIVQEEVDEILALIKKDPKAIGNLDALLREKAETHGKLDEMLKKAEWAQLATLAANAKKRVARLDAKKLFADKAAVILKQVQVLLEEYPDLHNAPAAIDQNSLARLTAKTGALRDLRELRLANEQIGQLRDKAAELLQQNPRLWDLRQAMYRTVQSCMSEETPVPPFNHELPKELDARLRGLDQRTKDAKAMIEKITAAAGENAQLKITSDHAVYLLELDRKHRTYGIIKSVLVNAPKDAESIASRIAELAPPGVERPKVPGTRMQGGPFNPRYCLSENGKSLLAAYVAIDNILKSENLAIIGANELRSSCQEVLKARDDYYARYLAYWGDGKDETVLTDLLLDDAQWDTWDKCQVKLGMRAVRFCESVVELGKTINRARSEALPQEDPRRAFFVEPAANWYALVDTALAKWSALSPDPFAARAELLKANVQEFRDYFPEFGPDRPDAKRLAECYVWDVMYRKLPDVLYNEARKNVDKRMSRLRGDLAGFPLIQSDAGTVPAKVLSAKQIEEARTELAAIEHELREKIPSPLKPAFDEKEAEFPKKLKIICAFLGQNRRCTVTIKEADSKDFINIYPFVLMDGRAVQIRGAGKDVEFPVEFPADKSPSVLFVSTQQPDPKRLTWALELPAAWTIVQYLRSGSRDGCQWETTGQGGADCDVLLKVAFRNGDQWGELTLKLIIEFKDKDAKIPNPQDWPIEKDIKP